MYDNFLIITPIILLFIIKDLTQIKYNEINNLNKENYKKMYSIIYEKSNLKNDLNNRKISKKVVIKFIEICNENNILIDNINDETFDFIYKKYVDYQIHKYENLKI